MDGNRRYARTKKISLIDGYMLGAQVMKESIGNCLTYGIRAITVYVFSIENFKRPKAEIKALLSLVRSDMDLIEHLCQHGYKARVQFLGRLDLLPKDVQQYMRRVVERTSHNTNAVLNFCVGYTAREEIATAMRRTVADCTLTLDGSSNSSNASTGSCSSSISVDSLSENMYTAGCPPLDMIVRTSGERRLSDFLLWQCNRDNTEIVTVRCLWPEFGFIQLFWVFLGWQRRQRRDRRDGPALSGESCSEEEEGVQTVPPRQTQAWPIAVSLLIAGLLFVSCSYILMLNKSM
ncbi:Decaprenyl diphosphate synthase-like protein [Aspergillus pseudodeflectus]|uniref:Alkyl transferase n=1 Tax=Aspergillus pseudodeflectus TaxID=176178 RepID=A0ABR4K1X1_9EURO